MIIFPVLILTHNNFYDLQEAEKRRRRKKQNQYQKEKVRDWISNWILAP